MPIAEPIVSIIVPAYNAELFVRTTIESIFAQSFESYEVIVVNDGSTDGTERVLADFMTRITYVTQANRGPGAARNCALRHACGQYVALLDADDIWLPEYLKTMVALMQSPDKPDVVYPNAELFGVARWEGKRFQDIYPSTKPVTLQKLLKRECNVFISAMARRDAMLEVGGFDEAIRPGVEDLEMWLRMARRGYRFDFTDAVLVRYRKRRESLSSDTTKQHLGLMEVGKHLLATGNYSVPDLEIIKKIIERSRATVEFEQGKALILDGQFEGADRCLAAANTHFRSPRIAAIRTGLRIAPKFIAVIAKRRSRA